MSDFKFISNKLYCEDIPVNNIAKREGTPLYIYSKNTLTENYMRLDRAFASVPHMICYSVKCNSNITVLRTLAKCGSGFDIVSGGELFRVIRSGGDPSRVVFAGVGKSEKEIIYALNHNIKIFTVESESELERINAMASNMNTKAQVAIRVNPDVDPQTHRFISTGKKENKFGMDIERAKAAFHLAMMLSSVEPVGIHMHIGSQIVSSEPYAQALDKIVPMITELKRAGIPLQYIDIGGGLGIVYDTEIPQTPEEFASVIIPRIKGLGMTLVLEPGRYIAGNAGILVAKVEYIKQSGDKTFVILDAAFNDLIRPALYKAYHKIVPLVTNQNRQKIKADFVGPVCESGDFFAQDREIQSLQENEYVGIMSAGAYGFTMASNYNSRVRTAEVMVSENQYNIIRKRETWEDLIRNESISIKEYIK